MGSSQTASSAAAGVALVEAAAMLKTGKAAPRQWRGRRRLLGGPEPTRAAFHRAADDRRQPWLRRRGAKRRGPNGSNALLTRSSDPTPCHARLVPTLTRRDRVGS